MKYGCRIDDWNLFSIEKLEEVIELKEDLVKYDAFGKHILSKDEYVWVKAVSNIFIVPKEVDGHLEYYRTNEGPYLRKCIFDTEEKANEYGHYASSCFIF